MEHNMITEKKLKIILIVNTVIIIALLATVIALFCTAQKVQNATDIDIDRIVGYNVVRMEITMPDSTKYTILGDTVEGKEKISKLGEGIDNSMYIAAHRANNLLGLPISVKIITSDSEKILDIYGWAVRYDSNYYKTNVNFSDIIVDILEITYPSN